MAPFAPLSPSCWSSLDPITAPMISVIISFPLLRLGERATSLEVPPFRPFHMRDFADRSLHHRSRPARQTRLCSSLQHHPHPLSLASGTHIGTELRSRSDIESGSYAGVELMVICSLSCRRRNYPGHLTVICPIRDKHWFDGSIIAHQVPRCRLNT